MSICCILIFLYNRGSLYRKFIPVLLNSWFFLFQALRRQQSLQQWQKFFFFEGSGDGGLLPANRIFSFGNITVYSLFMHKYICKILKHSMQCFFFFKFTPIFQAVKLVVPLKQTSIWFYDYLNSAIYLKMVELSGLVLTRIVMFACTDYRKKVKYF